MDIAVLLVLYVCVLVPFVVTAVIVCLFNNKFYLKYRKSQLILMLSVGYYLITFISDKIVISINYKIVGYFIKFTGYQGFLEEFIVQIVVAAPIFYMVNHLLKVRYANNLAKFMFFLAYSICNYIFWWGYLMFLARPV